MSGLAIALTVGIYALADTDPAHGDPTLFLYAAPLAICASLCGVRGGVAFALLVDGLVTIWWVRHGATEGAAWLGSRVVVTLLIGFLLGRLSDIRKVLTVQAFHDPLTGLPNRRLLFIEVERALARSRAAGSRVALFLLDLDRFKLVNDGFGHAAGDELLAAIAPRLLAALRCGDTVARLGGDEFAFLIEGFDSDDELRARADRILAAFARPFETRSGYHRVAATIGIAIAGRDATPESLLRDADTAMYRAKEHGSQRVEVFDQRMRARLLRELSVRDALLAALRDKELTVFYQPIVSLADSRPIAVEALLRWPHPQWGWVAPREFIPLAEQHGLILELGRYVLADAAARAALLNRLVAPLPVFVNMSPQELAAPDIVTAFRTVVHEHGLRYSQIGLEITERALLDEHDHTLTANVEALAELGVPLGLDDFGTGYADLAAIQRFPFTVLKVDRSFVRSIRSPSDPAPIIAAAVSLGHALGLTVIAEGIENETQLECLRRLECDAGQGYFFARPQLPDDLIAYLQARPHLVPVPEPGARGHAA